MVVYTSSGDGVPTSKGLYDVTANETTTIGDVDTYRVTINTSGDQGNAFVAESADFEVKGSSIASASGSASATGSGAAAATSSGAAAGSGGLNGGEGLGHWLVVLWR